MAPQTDQERWISVGCALNVTLNVALQEYAEPLLEQYLNSIPRIINQTGFNNCLASQNSIDPKPLRFDPDNEKPPPAGNGVQLCYRALLLHEAELKKLPATEEKKNRPIPIDNVDEFARLYCAEYTKKNTDFKIGTADSSSMLNILAKASCFPDPVRTLAIHIRDKVRNSWAHAVIALWDDAKFNSAFSDMENLAQLALPNCQKLL
eukprot:GFUD01035577.1.p1 GENE.GFUD01035577.1~~GFUD01035577.1.p1  ORF type:complete len:206 (-),score=46.04 GFUD01035577.1:100-717(-)